MTKNLPPGTIIWCRNICEDGRVFLVTSKPDRLKYTLYEKTDGGYNRIGVDDSPLSLEEKFVWPSKKKTKKK